MGRAFFFSNTLRAAFNIELELVVYKMRDRRIYNLPQTSVFVYGGQWGECLGGTCILWV
jgi:hypothetical protein